ncbi:MAG: peptidoglycan-binding protein, partial [Xanthomonadaceae bacterium]|nr:peptidoglycan-binding protein [Xanthomonadaceae bacterium]
LPAARRARWLRATLSLALLLVLLAAAWTWWRARPASIPGAMSAMTAPAQPAADAIALRRVLATTQDSRLLAWSALLARWQVTSQDTSVAAAAQCEARIFPGFFCVSGSGSLEQLQRFNRPLILELQLDGAARYALLLGVGDGRVTLDVGGRDFVLTPMALAALWHGRFYAGFRVPASTPLSLRRGDHGDAVAWLADALARADGAPLPADADVFDATLAARVRALQRRFGIHADAVVGPETLFALSALEPDGPHLAREQP